MTAYSPEGPRLRPLWAHVWMALYRPYTGGLLRYRDGSLHPYQGGR